MWEQLQARYWIIQGLTKGYLEDYSTSPLSGQIFLLLSKPSTSSHIVLKLLKWKQHFERSDMSSLVGLGVLVQAQCTKSLSTFYDTDWVVCSNTRRSVTSYVVNLGTLSIFRSTRISPLFLEALLK